MLRRLLTSTLLLCLLTPTSAFAAGAWRWPVRGEVITSYRNGDDPYAAGQHRGIDIAGAVGAPVVAAVGGEVRYAGALGSSGTVVSVRTADGAYDTSYLHLSSVAVGRGAHVAEGDRLGAVGTTGERSAAAPHLHFGVREAGQRQAYLDPLGLLGPIGGGSGSPQAAPAPLTVPAPAPAAAPRVVSVKPRGAPVRAPRPAASRAPGRAWRPFRAPAPVHAVRRTAAQAPRLRGVTVSPAGARQPARARGGARHPASATSAAGHRIAQRQGVERQVRSPAAGPATTLHDTAEPSVHASGPRARAVAPDGGGGPDLGLVLAGLSVLAAAVGLGLRGRGEGGGSRKGAYRVKRARTRPAHQP